MAKSNEFIDSLSKYAIIYIEKCLDSTKEVATGSGKIVEVKERHIPTIDYFLSIWLPKQIGETMSRETYYTWLRSDNTVKSDTIKNIDDQFKALAGDIVANEQKGIFYAKNKLGWTDKQTHDLNVNQINANFGSAIQSAPKPEDNTRLD